MLEVASTITQAWIDELAQAMEANTHCSVPRRISKILSASSVEMLLTRATAVLKKEKTLVRRAPSTDVEEIIVVGDTHGQYHDVLKLFSPRW